MGRQTAIKPDFASERTAAALLDMTPAELRRLVDSGALPGPVYLDRWDVAALAAIMRGSKPKPSEDFVL